MRPIAYLTRGGGTVHKLRFLGAVLLLTLVGGGGSAQSPADKPRKSGFGQYYEQPGKKPVWTLEYIEVKPGMFGPAMGYLDDNWMRVREEAQHNGIVLAYHRIAEQASDKNDWNVVLITEFKNQAASDASEKEFDAILKRLPQDTSAVIRGFKPGDLFQSVSKRTFQDFTESADPQFRLLSKLQ
jgi:hypothetical protein